MQAIEQVFQMFEKPDYAQFEKASTDWIYCILCRLSPHPRHYYKMRRKDFFENHIESLNEFEDFQRAKKSRKIVLIEEFDKDDEYAVCIDAWKSDEAVDGHCGSCLAIHFHRHGNGFLFSGISTIP